MSLLISPDACYGEKMYSGRQCQNKAEDIKADSTATSSATNSQRRRGELQISLAVLTFSEANAFLLITKMLW